LSATIPLVPPLAYNVAEVVVGSDPWRTVGTAKDITHPALVGQVTGLVVLPADSTLRKIQSVGLLNTSDTGEQVAAPVVRLASTVVGLVDMVLVAIPTW
jgi:hypothetical protein